MALGRVAVAPIGHPPASLTWVGGPVTNPVQLPDGSAAAPALTFASDLALGLYRVGVNAIGIATAGVGRWQVDANGHLLAVSDNAYDIGANGASRPRNVYIAGALAVAGATTLSAALTYGGVTLANAVTGTGNMVLSANPTFTGTVTAATLNATTLGGTLSTAAQPNVTSVGTLSTLAVSGSTSSFAHTGTPLALNNSTTSATIRTHLAFQENTFNKWYLGLDASDNGVILNAAADTANLTWTDAGAFTMRAGLTATIGTFTLNQNATTTVSVNNSDTTNGSSRANFTATSGTVTAAVTAIGTTIPGVYIGSNSAHEVYLMSGGSTRITLAAASGAVTFTGAVSGITTLAIAGALSGVTSLTLSAAINMTAGQHLYLAGTTESLRRSAANQVKLMVGSSDVFQWEGAQFGALVSNVVFGYSGTPWRSGYFTDVNVNAMTSLGGSAGVLAMANATTTPSSNPTGGGILYAEAGALKWRGSGGTTTTIANA